MGWFNNDKKGEKKGSKKDNSDDLKIPELPKLPELPGQKNQSMAPPSLNQLPSYPSNSLGDKFSQNTIKEAVTGKREVDNGGYAEDSEEDLMMQMPPKTRPMDFEEEMIIPKRKRPVPSGFEEAAHKVKKAEPIFIRLDKFESTVKTFEKAKEQLKEIDEMLRDLKKIKEEEEAELELWEKEMQTIRNKITKVDKDLFSMLE